jgi:hypothetical protein
MKAFVLAGGMGRGVRPLTGRSQRILRSLRSGTAQHCRMLDTVFPSCRKLV